MRCTNAPFNVRGYFVELTGVFWVVGAAACTYPSGVNADGLRDGIDVAGFVAFLLEP